MASPFFVDYPIKNRSGIPKSNPSGKLLTISDLVINSNLSILQTQLIKRPELWSSIIIEGWGYFTMVIKWFLTWPSYNAYRKWFFWVYKVLINILFNCFLNACLAEMILILKLNYFLVIRHVFKNCNLYLLFCSYLFFFWIDK